MMEVNFWRLLKNFRFLQFFHNSSNLQEKACSTLAYINWSAGIYEQMISASTKQVITIDQYNI